MVCHLRLLLLLSLTACSSGPSNAKNGGLPEPGRFRTPEAWSPEMVEIEASTGILLADLDRTMRAWNKLELTGTDKVDERTAKALADDLMFKATKHQDLLIEQLQSEAVANRRVAAMALGFSRQNAGLVLGMRHVEDGAPGYNVVRNNALNNQDPLPPLLVALDDPDPLVAANAALAIGLLHRKDTPLGSLLETLELHPSPITRSQAAGALRKIHQAGGEDPRLLPLARRALLDPEPAVRTQCALILALALDEESIDDLAMLLHDDENLAATAGARSLAYIGTRIESAKGKCARALTGAMGQVRPRVRKSIIANLSMLAGANYGNDRDQEWIEWAHRLP